MELISMVVLLITIMTFILPTNMPFLVLPLVMLIPGLFTPTLLITITPQKLVYVAWMRIYLLALPVWNFVLPIYFKDGDFDALKVSLHQWEDYKCRRHQFDKCHNCLNSNLDSESQHNLCSLDQDLDDATIFFTSP
ncbi:hypothetical protein L0F63_001638 [Massospora cicadina]|nr:hypothetical protein L0F63_001638 [Massospora cicadina]